MTCRSSAVLVRVALLVVLVLTGCSDSKKSFTLKGTVSYRDKPLSSGVVRLHMADDRVAMAMIQPDGTFEATDVLPGEAKVAIADDMAKRQQMAGAPGKGGPKKPASEKQSPTPPVAIPTKYKDPNTSGLKFTLKAGAPLDIQLK